ncbi:MAG: tRNA uridine-5-carboxymethylaminomethyl(34) synthesis GTPase MnmE [Candidatus Gastranaerophilales bacterium]|nr:tRNA uridine-5-carboxymethylaminomethyl(34) synthesis GTPase MnmE [Candidatus Gastranaerophilales bacterium]
MNITQEFDTITAIATPVGTGGVGVIRISGEKSFEIAEKIFSQKLVAGKIHHGWIKDENEKYIDEVIILPFKSPNSYTGEDVVEIQCHGGINVLRNILDLVLQNGARPAQRGEFTKRAFLNHKLDLSQAEAVCDLIHAKTQNFAVKSAKNLSGVLSEKIKEIKKDIFEVLSKIVAGIDFPDDVKEPEYDYLRAEFQKAIKKIDEILACARSSNILRQGIKIAILGKPNVGKSSLFNALLSLNRAIVTDIAGTTRDILTETIDIEGIPVTLIDTAGIRELSQVGKVEEIGIEFSKQSAQDADLILFLFDASTSINEDDEAILNLIKDKNYVILANKADLLKEQASLSRLPFTVYPLSTVTKQGFDELKQKIKEFVGGKSIEDTEFITNSRQQDCLEKSRESLNQALLAVQIRELQDLISIDVKSALLYLEEITGEVITDDILNNIFDNFCIGK